MDTKIAPQKDFPLLERFKKHFPVTHETIFAYDGVIYTNHNLPKHLIIHEQTHHKQQKKYGLDNWVDRYINNPEYRLRYEIEAYRAQVKSISNRNDRIKLILDCADNLSSELYGNLIDRRQAIAKLSD